MLFLQPYFCSNGNFVNIGAVGKSVDKSEDNVFKKEKRCYFFLLFFMKL